MQTSTDSKLMHDSPKLTSFIALRANGWSLASISLEISVPKSTLWEWDAKHQDQIRRLKQVQLEKIQERFLSTYEDELARLSLYLHTIERTLEKCRFDEMSPAFLLQTALYLRSRLARLCEQASDPNASATIGRITSHPYDQFTDDDLEVGRSACLADLSAIASATAEASAQRQVPAEPPSVTGPHESDHGIARPAAAAEPQPENPGSAPPKPDETPRGVENRSLIISHLQQHTGRSRPVLHSRNDVDNHPPTHLATDAFPKPA